MKVRFALALVSVTAFAAPCIGVSVAWGAAPVVDQSTQAGAAARSSGGYASAPVRTGPAAAETIALRRQLADLTLELEQLRVEVRELRGQLESQTHQTESLKTRNREALADIDKRLRELERRGSSAPGAAAVVPDSGKATATPATATEQREYDAAFRLLKEGYYEKAGKSFREFVAKHPHSELAGNAQYWVGEALYVVRNFKPALDEFSKVTDKYPGSPKVADALLKVGYCQHELGNLDKAREALQQVMARYPNTSTAKSAEKRLADVKAAEAKKAAAAKPKAPAQKPAAKVPARPVEAKKP